MKGNRLTKSGAGPKRLVKASGTPRKIMKRPQWRPGNLHWMVNGKPACKTPGIVSALLMPVYPEVVNCLECIKKYRD